MDAITAQDYTRLHPTRRFEGHRLSLHRNAFLSLAIAAMLALFAFLPSNAYAQDSIEELEKDTNAGGNKRVATVGRVFGEMGMGLLGVLGGAAIGVGILEGLNSWGGLFWGIAIGELAITPLTAGGVYLGGWITGGRGKAGPTFGGAYIGAIPGYVCTIVGLTSSAEGAFYAGLIMTPILSLVGAIVGFELSDKSETDRLKKERDSLQGPILQRSAPIMVTLYKGAF